MSIFNSIRKSRQQAKDHMSKLAEQKKKEDEKEPYRHVPTHAASDAFAAAPPAWRETSDRPRIIEQNRRRSAMAASGHHMNMPSVPRVGSSLSYMSYPGPGAYSASSSSAAMASSGRMRVPRSYSAAGISPYPDGSRDIIYSIPDVAYSEPASLKDYTPKDYTPKDYSPSQDGSSSSQDDLEMPKTSRPPVASGNGRPASKAHRLHPSSRSRRTSDASVDRGGVAAPAAATSAAAAPRQESWLPQRGSSLGYTPLQVGVAAKPLDASAIAPEPLTTRVNAHEDTLRALEARQNPVTKTGPLQSGGPSHAEAGPSTRTTRFTELEPTDSRVPAKEVEEPAPVAATPPAPAPQPIINSFPEPASESRDPSPPPKSKSKKLTKGGGKLLKKNR
jgi:hypothetical protein